MTLSARTHEGVVGNPSDIQERLQSQTRINSAWAQIESRTSLSGHNPAMKSAVLVWPVILSVSTHTRKCSAAAESSVPTRTRCW